jgi:hypothetical protein
LANDDAARAYASQVIRQLQASGGHDDPGLILEVRNERRVARPGLFLSQALVKASQGRRSLGLSLEPHGKPPSRFARKAAGEAWQSFRGRLSGIENYFWCTLSWSGRCIRYWRSGIVRGTGIRCSSCSVVFARKFFVVASDLKFCPTGPCAASRTRLQP